MEASGSFEDMVNMHAYKVVSADFKGPVRRVNILGRDGKKIQLKVHRFALVGKGDSLCVDPHHPKQFFVPSCEDPKDLIKLSPHFSCTETLQLGKVFYPLRITEITNAEELDHYAYLEQFHYKTSTLVQDSLAENDRTGPSDTGGRKAVLLCYLKTGERWEPVGYIELQMPLMMVKPRHLLFDHPFRHPVRPIEWKHWDQYALKRFVNVIVRIARVVTSPEYRGLGLAKLLIKSAKTYSRERWHVRGRRPLFIEILAEMLNYMDFVSAAGLRFVGKTEGNVDRVLKDLISMQRGQKITSGIMTLQKKYLKNFVRATDALGKDFNETLARLAEVCKNPSNIHFLGTEDWFLFRSVFRLPIPYYIGGLDEQADHYLDEHVPSESPGAGDGHPAPARPVSISIRGLRATSEIALSDNNVVRKIMDCFGLRGERISNAIFGPVDMNLISGNTLFVAGASGTGKSVLLRALDPEFSNTNIRVSRHGDIQHNYTAGWMHEIDSDLPLIQHFSEQYGTERAISALNRAGLSEAFVYLKPYKMLSRGQRYRAKLADLVLRQDDIWLIDEFCADLDPLTARIVSRNLRRHVAKQRRVAVVAAANYNHFLDALNPSRILLLRHGARAEWFNFKEFIDEFHDTPR